MSMQDAFGFDPTGGFAGPGAGGETTGRYLVLFQEDAVEAGINSLKDEAGLKVSRAKDADLAGISSTAGGELDGQDAVVFEEIGVAVLNAAPDQMQRVGVAGAAAGTILAIEPERVVYALAELAEVFPAPVTESPAELAPTPGTMPTAEYLRGYKQAVDSLVLSLIGRETELEPHAAELAPAVDLTQGTWGLWATGVMKSRYSGKGIALAVLDTGLDLTHPDFATRSVVAQSFVPGQAVQDGNGHGTHCMGTAGGPAKPVRLPRYGIANNSQAHVGKVLSNQGSGSDGGILAGINWAIANGCAVISMSLGRAASPGEPFSTIYETVARRALNRGSLIIAAAGNESQRPAVINPVGHPANCPSIMAVAAVDIRMRPGFFSNGGINPSGGEVNIAGPGVDVYSSWRMPLQYRSIQGTSMATPHVAGCAALWAEATGLRGLDLARQVLRSARRLPLPVRDAGWGLVQAP